MDVRRLVWVGVWIGVVMCLSSAAQSQAPQTPRAPQTRDRPQTRPAPGGQAGGSPGRPSRPGGGSRPSPGGSNRPSPGGGPQIQPPRPGVTRPPVRPNPPRPPRPVRPNRPAQWGRPPQNRPSYSFRRTDREFLRRHYRSHFGYINRARRPHFVMGGFFPYADIGYISPLPPTLYGALPPPPMGYAMGYFDGYVVVYDPVSYFIANVIDLL